MHEPMRFDVHIHHDPSRIEEKLDLIIHRLEHMEHKIMALLDDIVAKITALTAVDDSVVALLTDLKAKLDAAIASNDPVKLQAISDALGAQTQRLSDAVVANTPAATP